MLREVCREVSNSAHAHDRAFVQCDHGRAGRDRGWTAEIFGFEGEDHGLEGQDHGFGGEDLGFAARDLDLEARAAFSNARQSSGGLASGYGLFPTSSFDPSAPTSRAAPREPPELGVSLRETAGSPDDRITPFGAKRKMEEVRALRRP